MYGRTLLVDVSQYTRVMVPGMRICSNFKDELLSVDWALNLSSSLCDSASAEYWSGESMASTLESTSALSLPEMCRMLFWAFV